ncbi:argininosuccinate lyase [Microbacterium esteraromaticum]|uniref:Argininosuccinate lyase n=1 Tax=Microbacterium esteraromaticum TaxID=57043 RepID=A0A7D8AE24_9MICO|nr:argininosuccinate lyase [Microbacterium esteraromaticum]QMU96682.1 argininosuccinate lyase [Microbacterium esteraromaticum]
MNRDEIIQRDGETFPGESYTTAVLRPAYDQAKRMLLPSMIQIHRAHLIMLHGAGILNDADAATIARSIDGLDLEALAASEYTGQFEDLFFTVEHEMMRIGGEVTGSLHTARSRNDMGMTLYRMVMRRQLLQVLDAAGELYETLVRLGTEHSSTLSLEHTHTQPAQPSILGHRFLAIADVLGRDIRRVQQAYESLDYSPMGGAALTGTGFAIDRDHMARLLGFRGLVENSYDAVAATDYIAHSAVALQLMAIDTGRSCVDFLTWCTAEFGLYRVAAPYVQISSIMPQKRNPVSIEHSRSLLSAASASAATVLTMMHNTPFGDIVDTEDDLQPYAWRAVETLTDVLHLLSGVLGTIQVNTDVMRERALSSFANATELADTLVRDGGLTFTQAHTVVSRIVREADAAGVVDVRTIDPQRVHEVVTEVAGRDVSLTPEDFARALDADNFVAVRTSTGGAAPREVARMAHARQQTAEEFRQWRDDVRAHLDAVADELVAATAALGA